MSSRFVNPFTDLGFKIIFGQPASKALLIILLNELLSGEHHIEDLTFLDKEDRSENIHDKGIIYDLYCRTSTSEYIIVVGSFAGSAVNTPSTLVAFNTTSASISIPRRQAAESVVKNGLPVPAERITTRLLRNRLIASAQL